MTKEEKKQITNKELIKEFKDILEKVTGEDYYMCTWDGEEHPYKDKIEGFNDAREYFISELDKKHN